MSTLLENKICIITGAAQGIGRQIAKQFAEDGAIVYACDRQEFTTDNEHIHPVVMDITDAASVKANLMQIFKTEGRIDCLVNNAGITKDGLMMRMSVVFPAPLGPSRPTISPCFTLKETLFTTVRLPYFLTRFSA